MGTLLLSSQTLNTQQMLHFSAEDLPARHASHQSILDRVSLYDDEDKATSGTSLGMSRSSSTLETAFDYSAEAWTQPSTASSVMSSSAGLPPSAFLKSAMSRTQLIDDSHPAPYTLNAEQFASISPRPAMAGFPYMIDPLDLSPAPSLASTMTDRRESIVSDAGSVLTMASSVSESTMPASICIETVDWEDQDGPVSSWQISVRGTVVGRRTDNNFVNGTKALNVIMQAREEQLRRSKTTRTMTGHSSNVRLMTRGKRDGLLKAEKTRVVLKGGPVHIKGVWIPLERARALAEEWDSTHLFYPLFEDDLAQRIAMDRQVTTIPRHAILGSIPQIAEPPHHVPLPQAYQMTSSASLSGSDYSSASSPYHSAFPTPVPIFRHPFSDTLSSDFGLSRVDSATSLQTGSGRGTPTVNSDFARRGSLPVYPSDSFYSPPASHLSFALSSLSAPATATLPLCSLVPSSPTLYEMSGAAHMQSSFRSPTSGSRYSVPLVQPVPRRAAVDEAIEGLAFDQEGYDSQFAHPAKRLRYD